MFGSILLSQVEVIQKSLGQYVTIAKKSYNCHSRKNGTSTLQGHVKKCKKNPNNKNNDKNQPTIAYYYKKTAVEGKNDTKEIEVHQFFIKKIRLALARMIIVDELPLRFVEHEG